MFKSRRWPFILTISKIIKRAKVGMTQLYFKVKIWFCKRYFVESLEIFANISGTYLITYLQSVKFPVKVPFGFWKRNCNVSSEIAYRDWHWYNGVGEYCRWIYEHRRSRQWSTLPGQMINDVWNKRLQFHSPFFVGK